MNSYQDVQNKISQWSTMGLTKAELVVLIAEACMEWPYVWGGAGQKCTPGYRESYANRPACPEAEAKLILSQCQVCSGRKPGCSGCRWYPNGSCTLFFDCRGFTRWVLKQVGIQLAGAGATSQWNTNSNWTEKGTIDQMPNTVCCLFMQNQKDHKTMEHTGFHIGNGIIIHCSGEVKRGKTTDRGWTHYAIPVGLNGDAPVMKPTLRIGSTGEYVVECQSDLIQLGYDLSPYGADGKYGKKTASQVAKFQASRGLKSDGICGQQTWKALDEAIEPSPAPAKLYTVHIPHQTEEQCEELRKIIPDLWTTEE